MSKASRRRQRPGTNPPSSKPASSPPPAASTGSSSATAASSDPTVQVPATPRATGTASGAPRPSTTRSTSTRAGRRERQRTVAKPTFVQRYRTAIVVLAALAGVVLLSGFVFISAAQPAFACSTIWTPDPTASPAPGATPALGYIQPNMGAQHVAVGEKVTYTYCAPASGNHYNAPGTSGPIPARVYGPNDKVLPQGWIHNLEHGGIVILYTGNGPGATADGQAQLRALYDNFPNSPVCNFPKGQIAPVIARFDQMSSPIQAIVWGRVLLLDTIDQAKILAFYQQWGEKTNPEKQCAAPSASAAASTAPSTAPSAAPSTEPSATPVATNTPAPTPTPAETAAPSSN